MRGTFLYILEQLQLESITAQQTREKIKTLSKEPKKAQAFLDSLEDCVSPYNCINCGNRFFCSIFRAFAYFELDKADKMLSETKKAIRNINLSGSTWNKALANWAHGEACTINNQEILARGALEKATTQIDGLIKRYDVLRKYEQQKKCERLSKKIRVRLENLKVSIPPTTKEVASPQKNLRFMWNRKNPWKRSTLIFPVQSQVHAGIKGNFIFENQPDLDAALDELTFNEVPHFFYNIRQEGNPIILSPKVYRWIRVEGNSMNEATPIPIMDKDYVLAIDLNMSNLDISFGNIVIAELFNPTQPERAGVLKKYTRNGLESLSSEEYPIIPLGAANIRAVAIAIAKPQQEITNNASITKEIHYALKTENNKEIEPLFKNLLTKVLRDSATAIRLIEHEKELSPTATLKKLIQNAIDRWERDNR